MSSTNQIRATGRRVLRQTLLATAAVLAVAATAPAAFAAVGEDYDPDRGPVTTTWYGPVNAAALQADRDYIAGMRPHHAGALTMSQEYLADPGATNPALRHLAQAIVQNQRYEIGLLDEVGRRLDAPPVTYNLGLFRITLQPQATEGLAQMQRFLKAPIPGPLVFGAGQVSERDVQFAKAMTIHHQGALDMAKAYNANPNARNGFLRLLNVDIVTDQSQEIALMRRVVAAYSGDAAAVQVPASMVHGMEGMSHNSGGHAGHGAAPAGQMPAADPHASHGAPAAGPSASAGQPAAPSGHAGHGAAHHSH
jgi:uncharacterized protein (DUF305 family)